jgi:hypothetical protein
VTRTLWPTAVAHDDNKSVEVHLAMKKRMGERDGTHSNRTAITSLNVKTKDFLRRLYPSSLPDQTKSISGETSCKAEDNSLRLNPLFVSWLMGWPIIVPITCNFSATEWFRFKQRMRSVLFGLLCVPR